MVANLNPNWYVFCIGPEAVRTNHQPCPLFTAENCKRLSTEILQSEYGALCNQVQSLTVQSCVIALPLQPSSSALNS